MATGHPVRGGSPRVFGRAPDPAADQARAERARALLADGLSRTAAAVRLGLSASGLDSLFKRVAKRAEVEQAEIARRRAILDPDCAHLVCFDLPPELPPVERSPAEAAAWSPRLLFVGRMRDMANELKGVVRAEFLHLADLHEHHPVFYRNEKIPEGDGIPWKGTLPEPRGLIGSSAQACAEG